MNKIKLSIVIPTYNGAEWIEDTIDSVARQIFDHKDSVEFIIRDNASTNHVDKIVERKNKEYNGIIKYNRRVETAIADVNFREAIGLASGEYLLLLGDDDLLFPNFIEQSLRILNEYPDVGLLYYNRISTTRDYHGAELKHRNPNNTFFRCYGDIKQFIEDYPSGPDFMSVNVVRTDCIREGLSFAKPQYYGVEWYSAILYGIRDYKCISFFPPMVLQRAPLKRIWDDRALLYVIVGMDNMFLDLDTYACGIHKIWNDYSKRELSRFWYLTKCIPLNRRLYKEKYSELKPKLTKWEQFVALSLLHFPISYYLFRGLYLFKKIFKRVFLFR